MSLLSNSKKSKWIVGGIAAFAVIATASTGLASWVITKNGSATTGGQIKVATISDQYVDISGVSVAGTYCFGPSSGDTNGLIQSDGSDTESLSVTVTGTVTAGANATWTGLTGVFTVDNSESANTSTAIAAYTAATGTDNYLVAPTNGTYTKPAEFNGTANFEMTFSFAWGTAFGSENPSLYFDDDKTGTVEKTYANATVVLNNLEKLNNLKFVITISATTSAA